MSGCQTIAIYIEHHYSDNVNTRARYWDDTFAKSTPPQGSVRSGSSSAAAVAAAISPTTTLNWSVLISESSSILLAHNAQLGTVPVGVDSKSLDLEMIENDKLSGFVRVEN
jgi:hypothetical protein